MAALAFSGIAGAVTYTTTLLPTLGGTDSYANGINDSGQVVGFSYTAGNAARHATLWDSGAITDLGTLGGKHSQAHGINNSGQVVGCSETAGNAEKRATLWDGGAITALGTLGGTDSSATAINNSGQAIGFSYTAGNAAIRPTLWDGGAVTDLNSFLDASLQSAGWELVFASAINDAGSIVGNAYNNLSGETRGFVLAPSVPEPETYVLMLAGLGALVSMVRRKRAAMA